MTGETILHYTILEKLGEGGMGVVYKAEDTRLKRTVALKFLPPHLAASEGDKARFVQEAQAASALNHPNVCTIHDIQEHDGPGGAKQMFIVMEFVQGQTLRDLLGGKKGPEAVSGERTRFPLNRAIEIGIQIADGLGAAHEKGIVHRDIKPENIMVRKDGIAQIMDFGLAKLRSSSGSRLTQQGSTVGTAGYMSPEQIQGSDVDHRSDVFSLGVVLYELFSGELPFKGVHETALLYEIVNVDPPPMSAVNPAVGPELDRIVFECLQKEPDERFQSVKDISKELKRYRRESSRQRATRTMSVRQYATGQGGSAAHLPAGAGSAEGGTAAPREHQPAPAAGRPLMRWLWPAASLVLAAAVVFLALRKEPAAGPAPVMRFPVNLSVSSSLVLGAATLAVSPDGKHFAYLGGDPSNPMLHLRPMDRFEAAPMAGSEQASDPFFSANGQWVGFFAAGRMKKLSIFGGGSQDICAVPGFMRGGTWTADDRIFFGHLNRGVFRVPASGGTPEEVTVVDTAKGEISHRFPQLLPGGPWVLFTVKFNNITSFDDAVIAAENIETHERRELIRGGSYGRYIPTGHLMYARGKTLYAVAFDAARVEVAGTPIPVLEGGMLNPLSGTASFEISDNGILVYTPIGPQGVNDIAISWMDRGGKITRIIEQDQPFDNPKLSPDGTRIALTVRAANDDVWVYDTGRKSMTRLTFGGGNSDLPIWSPDGKDVIFQSEQRGAIELFRRSWDGSGSVTDIEIGKDVSPLATPAITPDGKSLLFGADGVLWSREIGGAGPARQVLQSSGYLDAPRMSPNGRVLAYSSNETGRNEVYAVPFPGLGGKWQISTGGASIGAIWHPLGNELYYVEQGRMMKVDVAYEPSIRFSSPTEVCALPRDFYNAFDVSADGSKFLIGLSKTSQVAATQVNVVVNWFDELRQKFLSVKN
jgi:serine/threonine-protein kinase